MPQFRTLVHLSLLSSLGLGLFLFISLLYSAPLEEHLVVHRQLDKVPSQFVRIGDAHPQSSVKLTVVLNSRNMSGLADRLLEVSNPTSPNYGQHLSLEEVDSYVRPSEEASKSLQTWLSRNDVSPQSTSSAGHIHILSVPVSKANLMFNTTFTDYLDVSSNRTVVRTERYSLPPGLATHIQHISGTTQFPVGSRPSSPLVHPSGLPRRSTASDSDNAEGPFPLSFIRRLYDVPDNAAQNGTDPVAVLTTGSEVSPIDIALFMRSNFPEVAPSVLRIDLSSVDGGDNIPSQTDFSSSSEDIEMILNIAPTTPIRFLVAPDFDNMLDMLNLIKEQEDPPSVVMLNPTSPEGDVADSAGPLCDTIMQLGARGITVIVPSGDGGVTGQDKSGCLAKGEFQPNFPATCPYATSVGATSICQDGAENAAFFSGGGFSNLFPIPSYQSDAVTGYLAQIGTTNEGRFNSSGRGFPDVAFMATSVQTLMEGSLALSQSTELSACTFSGMVAVLNAERRAKGSSPFGFLNPLLYSHQDAFNDITQGSNSGCGDVDSISGCLVNPNPTGAVNAFSAIKGWDPASGLGTLNFPAFQKLS